MKFHKYPCSSYDIICRVYLTKIIIFILVQYFIYDGLLKRPLKIIQQSMLPIGLINKLNNIFIELILQLTDAQTFKRLTIKFCTLTMVTVPMITKELKRIIKVFIDNL